MELIKEKEEYLEVLLSDDIKTSVNGDIIVPDVKPDVLKVLQVDSRSVITDKGISSKGIYAEGKLYINILYIPDSDESGICCIKTVLDFNEKADIANVSQDMKLKISSDVTKVEFTLLNSRKLSLRTTVLLSYELVGEKEIELVSGFDGESGEYIKKTIIQDRITAQEECEFVVRDSMEIMSGKQSLGEILKIDVKICDVENKVLPAKLITKGVLNVCVLYLTDDNKIDYCTGEFPFTEVFDVYDLNEDDHIRLDLDISELSCDVAEDNDGDLRIINIECLINASLRAECKKEISLIADCYCAGMDTEITYNEVYIKHFADNIMTKNTVKDVISPDDKLPKIVKVYNVICEPEITKAYCDDMRVITEGKIKTYVLYITDNAKCSVFTIKKDIPFSYSHEAENAVPDMDCSVKIEADNVSYNINAAGEIEIRCTLFQDIKVTKNEKTALITDAKTTPKNENKDIVIYFVKDGDTLWDISKKYSVKSADVMAVNSLESDKITKGMKLLIPSCK